MRKKKKEGGLTKEMETMRTLLDEAHEYFVGVRSFPISKLTTPPKSLRVRKADPNHVRDVKVPVTVH